MPSKKKEAHDKHVQILAKTVNTDFSADSENSQLPALREATSPGLASLLSYRTKPWVLTLPVRRVTAQKTGLEGNLRASGSYLI